MIIVNVKDRDITYGFSIDSSSTSLSIVLVTHGPPNQKVGIASSSVVVTITDEGFFKDAVLAVFNKTSETIPVIRPINNPIPMPAIKSLFSLLT